MFFVSGTAAAKPVWRTAQALGEVVRIAERVAGKASGGAKPRNRGRQKAMENGSLIGLSRQIALQRELDVVANNIANLSTNGFKADGVIFQEHLMPVARANQFSAADSRL